MALQEDTKNYMQKATNPHESLNGYRKNASTQNQEKDNLKFLGYVMRKRGLENLLREKRGKVIQRDSYLTCLCE